MARHIHVYLQDVSVHDSGTSEGARKAALTRQQHSANEILTAEGHQFKGLKKTAHFGHFAHYKHPESGAYTRVSPKGEVNFQYKTGGKFGSSGVTKELAQHLAAGRRPEGRTVMKTGWTK